MLLLQGELQALRGVDEEGDYLLIEAIEPSVNLPRKAPLAVAIMLGVVVLAALDLAPLALLAMGGAAVMLATGCMRVNDALRALEPSVLLLIAAMIPLGGAMEATGLAEVVAEWTARVAGAGGPFVLVSAFYLLTSIITEFLSNNATAVLLTPIGIQVAAQMGMEPEPLLIAITFGASASFATPIGYQTNTMVMGPGGYRFGDYLRIGVPLNLILWIVASFLIPVFWPL